MMWRKQWSDYVKIYDTLNVKEFYDITKQVEMLRFYFEEILSFIKC